MADKSGPLRSQSALSRRAWLALAFGDGRQYAGNSGYDDDVSRVYRYDSNVANWKRVAENDLILIRNQAQLLGIARIVRLESWPSSKALQRCPVCRTTSIKERFRKVPRFRCANRHEFHQPDAEVVSCTAIEASFDSTFLPATGASVPMAMLRRACPAYTDQLSIQHIVLTDILEELMLAVPGLDALLDETRADDSMSETASRRTEREGPPPGGVLGVSYRTAVAGSMEFQRRELVELDLAAVERASCEHARLQNLLAENVRRLGGTPRSPAPTEPGYDIAWDDGEVLFVAEIKSLTAGNEERQLRLGLGQLLRYRHLLARGGRCVAGILLVERAPADRSWQLLCKELGIIILWPESLHELKLLVGREMPGAAASA